MTVMTFYRTKRRLALLALTTALTAVGPLTTLAQTQQSQGFDIPAQPLSSAVLVFAAATGLQVVADQRILGGLDAPTVRGQMTADAALARLLSGSGLSYHFADPTTVAITASSAADGGAIMLEPIIVDAGGVITEGSGSYTSGYTTVATGLPLTQRETPQSVSVTTRQKMDDQNLDTIADVLRQTAGISVQQLDSERTTVYARGFSNPTYLVDGIPVWYRIQYGSGPSIADTAIYDRVEVLRGATGLMAGSGDPSVAINMVRKTPTDALQSSVAVTGGSWDTYRADVDVSGPLTQDGRIRGRAVVSREDGNSFLDRYSREKTVVYGILEADVGDNGTLSFGVDYQRNKTVNTQFGGLPLIYSDGTQIDWDEGASSGGGNLPLRQDTLNLFTRYEHDLANGWKAQGDLSWYEAGRKGYLGAASWGSVNPNGTGAQTVGGYADTTTTQHNVSATLSGPVTLWGRQHDLRFGVLGTFGKDVHKAGRSFDGSEIEYVTIPGSIFDWDGSIPGLEAQGDYIGYQSTTKVDQISAYASGRFRLSDATSVIGGARVVWYDYDFATIDLDTGARTHQEISRNGEWIPYIGLTHDLSPNWTAYASYTRIFKQATYRDRNNTILEPTTGSNYELGLKASFYDDRLNFAGAVFRLEQDNLPTRDRDVAIILPDGGNPYKSIDGAITKGFELELSGEVLPGWEVAASYSHMKAENGTGDRISTVTPDDMVRVATSYRFADIPLTVGGNLSWQSDVMNTWTWPVSGTARQDSYTVVGLMARYEFDGGFSATLNVNNLLDERYLSSLDETYATGSYGAPRNVSLTLRKTF